MLQPARNAFRVVPIALWCLAGTAAVAAAQAPTLYTNRPSWEAAAPPANVITFEGIAPAGGFVPFDTAAGRIESGVRFFGATASPLKYYLRVVDAAYSTGYNWGSGAFLHGPPETVGPGGEGGPNSGIVMVPPAGITAIGADLMSFVQYQSVIRIEVNYANGSQYVFDVNSAAYPNRAFAGVVSTQPIFSIRFRGLTGFPALDNVAFGGVNALGAPRLTGSAAGNVVSFAWTPAPVSAPISGWRLEASVASYGPLVASIDTLNTSLVVPGVPAGTYFVRVRPLSGTTAGPISNDVVVTVGGACTAAPSPPTGLAASAQGGTLTASWTAPVSGCAPTSYVIRGGSAPGTTDIGAVNVGLTTGLVVNLPPGIYYLTVVAMNGAAASAPSNEVAVTVGGCTVPGAPANFTAGSALDVVTLTWTAPAGPVTRYRLEVGSAAGASNLAVVQWQGTALQTAGVARGTYYLRVRAENACGVGPGSAERVLTVSY
ncbi:MAG: hypothetical protein AB7H93_04585 [Vicinamibacterales bacterium]